MPRVIITDGAASGLERCRKYLTARDPAASRRAAVEIKRSLALLESRPAIGRPFAGEPPLRELVIAFGDSGYVALYHHDSECGEVLVLAFRHQRETGY